MFVHGYTMIEPGSDKKDSRISMLKSCFSTTVISIGIGISVGIGISYQSHHKS